MKDEMDASLLWKKISIWRVLLLLLLTMILLPSPLPAVEEIDPDILDVRCIPQSPLFHVRGDYDERLISEDVQRALFEQFRCRFFSPWKQVEPRHGRDLLEDIFSWLSARRGYGENRRLRGGDWLEEMRARAALDRWGSVNRRAITVRETGLRLLPTRTPFFYDFDLPGEGYPFDYLQNSLVHAAEPLFVSHLSRDGDWAWCETSYAAGWLHVDDLALVDDLFVKRWISRSMAVVVEEGCAVRKPDGLFLLRAKVGTVFPLRRRTMGVEVLSVPLRRLDGLATSCDVTISEGTVRRMPVAATRWNIASVAEQMIGEPYGWGGYLENRDCSATIRDIFLPFGIWLPRNSTAQAESGQFLALSGSEDERRRTILERGVPLLTLLHKRGHIMLYLGSYRGEPLILHNTWGIATLDEGGEGRRIVGKTVITTLSPGNEIEDLHPRKGALLKRLSGMILLGGKTASSEEAACR